MREDGYRKIRINGRSYLAHRLAWLYMTGEWPQNVIDHASGQRSDNRWENLRAASPLLNSHNRKRPSNNTSGFKGVTFYKAGNIWRAFIRVDGLLRFLGSFPTPELAADAYAAAANDHFGSFARTA
jgi:hypothetical protein